MAIKATLAIIVFLLFVLRPKLDFSKDGVFLWYGISNNRKYIKL